ncbi:UNVERIFIED_CONTAM: pectate lyase-like protein [Williamsia faeni]
MIRNIRRGGAEQVAASGGPPAEAEASGGSVNRRRLLAGSVAAAAAIPLLAACSSDDDAPASVPESPDLAESPNARNVKAFGAIGDGMADDTAAFAAACEGADDRLVLYVPSGTYLVNELPELPSFATVIGDGGDLSVIVYEGSGTLIEIDGKQRIAFKRIGIFVTGESSTALSISQSFRCSFDSVVIRGNHSGDNYPQYDKQRGVVLSGNSGGTAFINSDINNFGIGLTSKCIQNYVTSSKFTSNRIGVLGTGSDHNAGLSLTNVEFVSDNNPNTTDIHLIVDGAANDWWLTNVWFEGSSTAISIGGSTGGPSQFGLINAKLAAREICLDLRACRQPYLANVALDPDAGSNPEEIRIDSTNCPEGTAINLISGSAFDVPVSLFPQNWKVIGRGVESGSTFVSPVVMRKSNENSDILQFQGDGFRVTAGVTASGAWISEDAGAGVVLRGPDGRYFRLVVNGSGQLTTEDLGMTRPR